MAKEKGLSGKELRKKLAEQLLKGNLDLEVDPDDNNQVVIRTDYFKWDDKKYYLQAQSSEEQDEEEFEIEFDDDVDFDDDNDLDEEDY